MPVEVMTLFSLEIGIVTLALVVFQIIFFRSLQKFSYLIGRNRSRSTRLQFERPRSRLDGARHRRHCEIRFWVLSKGAGSCQNHRETKKPHEEHTKEINPQFLSSTLR